MISPLSFLRRNDILALPIYRVSHINMKTAKLMEEYSKEFKACHDSIRQMQIMSEISFIRLIISVINKPYVDLYKGSISDEDLKMLGLIDDEEE